MTKWIAAIGDTDSPETAAAKEAANAVGDWNWQAYLPEQG